MERSEIRELSYRMVRYRRNLVPGGTFFFTATLADRESRALVENIDLLRYAFRVTRHERPFSIDGVVVLPDHLHVVITLPTSDDNFPARWKRFKSLFTRLVVERGRAGDVTCVANTSYGSAAIGSIPSVTNPIWRGISTTFISIR